MSPVNRDGFRSVGGVVHGTVVEKWTPERRRQLTRTALTEAAAQVFARRGFNGASLEEIAAEAGFTRGAIYSNFENKEDLFFAVLERHNTAQLEAFAALLKEVDWDTRTARSAAAALWTAQSTDLDTLRLWLEFKLYALRNPQQRERLATFERKTIETVSCFISEHVAATGIVLTLPPSELAAILISSNQGLHEHLAVCGDTGPNLFERFLDLIMNSAIREAQPK